jgi:hypothetical protein
MIGGADEFGAFLKPLVVVKINACHYSSLCLELPKIKKMLMGFITKLEESTGFTGTVMAGVRGDEHFFS